MIFSHSSLSAFEQCPRKFWYAYIERPPIEKIDNIEAFLGTIVHETLEHLYQQVMANVILGLEEMLAWFDLAWDRRWSDDVRIVDPRKSPELLRSIGREELSAYYRQSYPFDDAMTLAVERRVWISLDTSGRYRLIGYIDRVAKRRDGVYEIHDYKSSAYIATQADVDSDRQLALYQLGVQQEFEDARNVELVWHYLRRGVELRSTRTPNQIEALKRRCRERMDDITSLGSDEESFLTRQSGLCRWCDFQAICPVMGRVGISG